jgi:uncharacterized membrane protein YqgA involved in biofilm formation
MDSNSHREKIKCLLRYDFIDDFTPVGCLVVLVTSYRQLKIEQQEQQNITQTTKD